MLRRTALRAYWFCESRIAPGLRYSQAVFEDFLRDAVRPGIRWLDVGCGHQLLPEWRLSQERALIERAGCVIGVDAYLPALRVHRTIHCRAVASIDSLPLADQSFDLVTANMVVEHLGQPAVGLREIWRVLRPGGRFLFHTPNARAYTTIAARLVPEIAKRPLAALLDGRAAEDVFPAYYRANTDAEIRKLAVGCNFVVEHIEFVATTAASAVFLPMAFCELLWLRRLLRPEMAARRPTLIVSLRRP